MFWNNIYNKLSRSRSLATLITRSLQWRHTCLYSDLKIFNRTDKLTNWQTDKPTNWQTDKTNCLTPSRMRARGKDTELLFSKLRAVSNNLCKWCIHVSNKATSTTVIMTTGMFAVCNYAIMQLANRKVHSKSISSCCTGFAATKPKWEGLQLYQLYLVDRVWTRYVIS